MIILISRFGIQLGDGENRKEQIRGYWCLCIKFDNIKNVGEWGIFWCLNEKNGEDNRFYEFINKT